MWIAGIFICLLAAAAIVAVVRAIPASYASVPVELEESQRSSENAFIDDQQAYVAPTRRAMHGQSPARCSECGFVESIRRLEASDNTGIAGDISGRALAGSVVTGKEYAITVRFRDGSTTVFYETGPSTWRLGSRVIVIGGSKASTASAADFAGLSIDGSRSAPRSISLNLKCGPDCEAL
jgi:hypothetical protein